MSWTASEVGYLLKLAETGAIEPDQLQRAAVQAPLRPTREAWLAAADRVFAFAGALLLAAAVVFFFAYNWSELHRFAKLGVALTVLAGCVGVALASHPFSTAYRAALLGACATTGALLALIGQTYQTGADIWELFAGWAVLMLPFALLARSSASWALWLVVTNAAVLRVLSESRWLFAVTEPGSLVLVAALNLVVLLCFEGGGSRLLIVPKRHLQRLGAVGMIVPLAGGAMVGWWEKSYLPLSILFLVVAAAAAWAYHHLRRDPAIVAMALFASIAVFASALLRLMPDGPRFLSMNVVALFVIVSSAFAGLWIKRLYRSGPAT